VALEFFKEQKIHMARAVVAFVDEQFEEEAGQLRAERILDSFVGLVGKSACNRGVSDARDYLQTKVGDLVSIDSQALHEVRLGTSAPVVTDFTQDARVTPPLRERRTRSSGRSLCPPNCRPIPIPVEQGAAFEWRRRSARRMVCTALLRVRRRGSRVPELLLLPHLY